MEEPRTTQQEWAWKQQGTPSSFLQKANKHKRPPKYLGRLPSTQGRTKIKQKCLWEGDDKYSSYLLSFITQNQLWLKQNYLKEANDNHQFSQFIIKQDFSNQCLKKLLPYVSCITSVGEFFHHQESLYDIILMRRTHLLEENPGKSHVKNHAGNTHVWWLRIRRAISAADIPPWKVKGPHSTLGSPTWSMNAGKRSPQNVWLWKSAGEV